MKPILVPNLFARIKRLLRTALPDALVIGVLIITAEITLRLFAPQYADQVFSHRLTGGQPIAINADGYRGQAVPLEKPEGTTRILALGDSTTFGTSVASDDTWPRQLASDLSQRLGSPVQAINAAMPAASLRELTHAYINKWAAYKPDRAVITLSNNFIALAYSRRNQDDRSPTNGFIAPASAKAKLIAQAKELYNRPALLRFLSINTERMLYLVGLAGHEIDNPTFPGGPMLAFGYRQSNLDPSVAEQAYGLFDADLTRLVEALRADGIEPIVTYLPSRFTLSDSFIDNEKFVPTDRLAIDPAQRITAICDRLGVTFLDATAPLKAERAAAEAAGEATPPLYIQFDFTHLDPRGHQTLAAALADTIYPTTPNPAGNAP